MTCAAAAQSVQKRDSEGGKTKIIGVNKIFVIVLHFSKYFHVFSIIKQLTYHMGYYTKKKGGKRSRT